MTVSNDSLLDLTKIKSSMALGDYRKIATDSLPVSAHLIGSTSYSIYTSRPIIAFTKQYFFEYIHHIVSTVSADQPMAV
jgi:hypothetical protein